MTSMPNFVIAGERRCGTTSLYHWMRCHPDIHLYPTPDLNFFTEKELLAREWQDGRVDGKRWERENNRQKYVELFRAANGHAAVGHKGADLLFWRPAHARVARYLPDAKFIITLRNPVKRAWSQYWNEVGKGREWLSFEKALSLEEERCRTSDYARFHLSYLARGFYEQSLAALFEHVSPSRVLIITVEKSKSEPEKALGEIYKFLGLDPTLGLEVAGVPRNENWTMVPRSWVGFPVVRTIERLYSRTSEGIIVRATRDVERRRKLRKIAQAVFRRPATGIAMSDQMRDRLTKTYEPHIQALESLLNRQFPEWRSN